MEIWSGSAYSLQIHANLGSRYLLLPCHNEIKFMLQISNLLFQVHPTPYRVLMYANILI